jgi:hypothetical protein
MNLALRMAAVGALVAATIHASALAVPAVAALYPFDYPSLRHVVFVAINLTLAGLFLRRPRWFVWAYAVLTIQVIAGHGGAAWASWHRNGHVALIDAAAIIAVPLALVLLVIDRRRRSEDHRRGL